MSPQIAETVLLTGAGFTRNFGGFLADEMWAEIFNHPEIRRSEKIRELMLRDFNYESIYDRILYGKDFQATYKEAIKTAVFEAYKNLDTAIVSSHRHGDALKWKLI